MEYDQAESAEDPPDTSSASPKRGVADIAVFNRHRGYRLDRSAMRRVVRQLLETTGHDGQGLHVTFVDDPEIQAINRETFDKNRATNVISYPLGGVPGDPSALLGDVIVSLDTAAREAGGAGMSTAARAVQLVIHGLLHILGYEHVGVAEAERRRMQRAERKVFGGIADLVETLDLLRERE